jgi:hypothetical protein
VAGIAQGLNVVRVSVADVRVEHEVKLTDFTKCLDMRDGASEPRQVRRRTRLFRVEINADENGSPTSNETAYPESFSGGIVLFLASKGEDCEELNLDLTFGSAAAGENKAEARRVGGRHLLGGSGRYCSFASAVAGHDCSLILNDMRHCALNFCFLVFFWT